MKSFMHTSGIGLYKIFKSSYSKYNFYLLNANRGSDESRCQVKMSGDMMLSFPAGIVNVLTNNPNPAKLIFRLKNIQNLETILPNKQIISM